MLFSVQNWLPYSLLKKPNCFDYFQFFLIFPATQSCNSEVFLEIQGASENAMCLYLANSVCFLQFENFQQFIDIYAILLEFLYHEIFSIILRLSPVLKSKNVSFISFKHCDFKSNLSVDVFIWKYFLSCFYFFFCPILNQTQSDVPYWERSERFYCTLDNGAKNCLIHELISHWLFFSNGEAQKSLEITICH